MLESSGPRSLSSWSILTGKRWVREKTTKERAISPIWPTGSCSDGVQGGFRGATFYKKLIQTMPQGTIKKIIADKGFGFIATEEGGSDLFFHRNGCSDSFEDLREGDAVEFTSAQSPKGPCAEDVKSV